MTGANSLTPRGSTNAWRKLRTQWQPLIEAGAIQCWRCQGQRGPLDPNNWHLGHIRDRNHGGTDVETRPEHPSCNLEHANDAKTPDRPTPSRVWFPEGLQ
jgi:hypothetical protein